MTKQKGIYYAYSEGVKAVHRFHDLRDVEYDGGV
jgi:hypothetical protein